MTSSQIFPTVASSTANPCGLLLTVEILGVVMYSQKICNLRTDIFLANLRITALSKKTKQKLKPGGLLYYQLLSLYGEEISDSLDKAKEKEV